MSSTEERLDRIEKKLDALIAALKTSGGRPAASAGSSGGGQEIDADIDGPRGDPADG